MVAPAEGAVSLAGVALGAVGLVMVVVVCATAVAAAAEQQPEAGSSLVRQLVIGDRNLHVLRRHRYGVEGEKYRAARTSEQDQQDQ